MKNMAIKNYSKVRKQQGVALLMALIMLLLVTIIGISAVKLSISDTQVAGNSMYKSIVFHGAEAGLSRTVSNTNLYNIIEPATDRTVINELTAFPDEVVIGGGKLMTKGTVQYEKNMEPPPYTSVGNSSGFIYQLFKVTAESKLKATSAKDKHSEGRAIQIPEG